MTDLSPAAQAVHDAFWSHPNGKPLAQDCPDTDQLAAALRAAADQLTFEDSLAGAVISPRELLDIAAELEGV